MADAITRIISDVHYGDRSSRVRSLAQLRPLGAGVATLVLNGDTLDTRTGPFPERTACSRAEVAEFFAGFGPAVTFVTGNHDPDFSPHHALELAGGRVLITHGDVLFDAIVPWSSDAGRFRAGMRAGLAALAPAERHNFEARLALARRVAASVPQRHHANPDRLKYAAGFLADTVWPPWRGLAILHTWLVLPGRAAELARRHRPKAKFVLTGHIHRPGVWRRGADGVVVVNTGSFCRPLGGYVVDLTSDRLTVRRIEVRQGDFHPGGVVAEFPLGG